MSKIRKQSPTENAPRISRPVSSHDYVAKFEWQGWTAFCSPPKRGQVILESRFATLARWVLGSSCAAVLAKLLSW